jgi:hypothetical protein
VTLSLILRFNLRLGGYSIWSASTSCIIYDQDFGARAPHSLEAIGSTWKITRGTRLKIQKHSMRSLEHSKTSSEVLDACRTRLRRARGLVRPGAAGLLTGVEYSKVRNSSWMYLTSFVTTRIGLETCCSTRKLQDRVVVGLQLYSARTFHVTLSPRIYKGGQGPPRNTSTSMAIQTTTQDVGYYATRRPNLSKSLCSLHHRVPEPSIPTYKPYC